MNSMAERGIRIRASHSLEDYLAEDAEVSGPVEERSDDGSSAEDWGEEDIEFGSSELARLKPYGYS